MQTPKSVCDVIALAAETWINEGIRGSVAEIKTVPKKAGGQFYKVVLRDEQYPNVIAFSAFTAPRFAVGDVLEITGKGIMRGEYNGQPELKVGKDAVIRPVGKSQESVQAAAAVKPTPTASYPSNPPPAGASTPALIHGATAGMAINRAVEVMLATNDKQMFAGDHQTWKRRVYTLALGFVEVSTALETGKDLPSDPF